MFGIEDKLDQLDDLDRYQESLIKQGYDGVFIDTNSWDPMSRPFNQIVIFDSSQAKSTSNTGLFESTTGNINE